MTPQERQLLFETLAQVLRNQAFIMTMIGRMENQTNKPEICGMIEMAFNAANDLSSLVDEMRMS